MQNAVFLFFPLVSLKILPVKADSFEQNEEQPRSVILQQENNTAIDNQPSDTQADTVVDDEVHDTTVEQNDVTKQLAPESEQEISPSETIVEDEDTEQKNTSSAEAVEQKSASPAETAVMDKKEIQKKIAQTIFEDWKTFDQLSPAMQQEPQAQVCRGAYQEPDYLGLLGYKGDDLATHIEADHSEYQQGGESFVSGNVIFHKGNQLILAEQARLKENNKRALLDGMFTLREPGLLIAGNDGDYRVDTKEVTVNDAAFLVYNPTMHGNAKKLDRLTNGTYQLSKATYTTCPSNTPFWSLKGSSFKFDTEAGFGTARNARLTIWDVPVFYTPLFYFPIDKKRHTGFLFPTVSESSDTGFDVSLPYYLNLAPNYDMTITPRFMSKRGFLLENELRYLGKGYKGQLGVAGLGNDLQEKENLYYGKGRWLINLQHQQYINEYVDYKIDYSDASDKEYLDDFGTSFDLSSENPLWQQFNLRLHSKADSQFQWQFQANVQQAENMSVDSDDAYQREPQLIASGQYNFDSGLSLSYLADYNKFNRDENWQFKHRYWVDPEHTIEDSIYGSADPDSITNAVGERLWLETGLKYNLRNNWSYIEPAVTFKQVNYQLERLDDDYINKVKGSDPTLSRDEILNPGVSAPVYSIDSGLFFDRNLTIGSTGFTQTFEPRMLYVYTPYRKNQYLQPNFDTGYLSFNYNTLWNRDQFVGQDRIGNTNHIALGFSTAFFEQNGIERLQFGLGQIFYFEDRKVIIDPTATDETNPDYSEDQALAKLRRDNESRVSPIATQLSWTMTEHLRLTQDWAFNTAENKVSEYSVNLGYKPETNKLLQLRYHFRDQVDRYKKDELGNNTNTLLDGDLEEVSTSFIWSLGVNWSGFGRWSYDITNKRNMERMIGFGRNSCCNRVQVAYKVWVDPYDPVETAEEKNGLFFEFELVGLGSVTGNQVKNLTRDIGSVGYY